MQGCRDGFRVCVLARRQGQTIWRSGHKAQGSMAKSKHGKRRRHGRLLALRWTALQSSYAVAEAHHVNVSPRLGCPPPKCGCGARQGSLVHPVPCARGCLAYLPRMEAEAFALSLSRILCAVARSSALTVFLGRVSCTAQHCTARQQQICCHRRCASLQLPHTESLHSSFLCTLGPVLHC